MRLSSARMGRISTGAPSGRRSITPSLSVRWLPNCVKCVTLVVELGVDAEPVQDLVGVVEVASVHDGGRQAGGRAHRDDGVEVELSAPAGESSTVRRPWRIADG